MKKFLSKFSFEHGFIKGIVFSIGIAKDDCDEVTFIFMFICYGFAINYDLN